MALISIAPGLRRKTRMKFLIDCDSPMNANVPRQVGIPANYPGFAAARHGCIKMNYLRVGVHTGIGTPGAVHAHGSGGDFGKSDFELVLDGYHALVRL